MIVLPNTATLTFHLTRLFYKDGASQDPVKVLSRQKCVYTSTFPTEIITIQLKNEQVIALFCKYVGGMEHSSFGHRGGLEYEIKMYEEVLKDVPLSRLQYYGKCYIPEFNETLIVLEYLVNGWRIHHLPHPEFNLKLAARWIAGFHRFFEGTTPYFVRIYDEAYYRLWVEKVKKLSPEFKNECPWLEDLCTYFLDHFQKLTNSPQTLIHGEFYPRNILVQNKVIYVVDWESAAEGPGEIDLATLIDGWEDEITEGTIEAYKTIRWRGSQNVPPEFEQLLLLSQIYLQFRWIIEFERSWFERPSTTRQLSRIAKKIGWIH